MGKTVAPLLRSQHVCRVTIRIANWINDTIALASFNNRRYVITPPPLTSGRKWITNDNFPDEIIISSPCPIRTIDF
jgi:hypothetical protein